MKRNGGDPIIDPRRVVDATIVGFVVFFSILLGDAVFAILLNDGIYLTESDIWHRFITALVGFFLTFFAQWARYRGLEVASGLK